VSPTAKLLVFDLDGTLLDRNQRVPAKLRTLLLQLRAEGIETTIATGRIHAAAAPFIRSLEIGIPVILFNGALLAEPDGTPRSVHSLPLSDALAALEIARDHPIHPQLYLRPIDRCFYAGELTEPLREFSRKDGIPSQVVGDLAAYLRAAALDPMKLLFVGPREQLIRFREEFRSVAPDPTCVLSETTYLEILPPGITKGVALLELSQAIGVPTDQMIAFGDNHNDAEMIEAAGVGVAMSTAPARMRECAQAVAVDLETFLWDRFADRIPMGAAG
jgi:Cof subfamily protein (haloacid dehalogenase superfamily)